MRRRLLVSSILLLLSACTTTDFGKPCLLHQLDGGVWYGASNSSSDDFLDNGTAECEDFVCLRPAGSPLDAGYGICSNICTPDNGAAEGPSQDCSGGQSGLVCRTITLDPGFIKTLEAEDGGAALLQEYLGGANATYCATPD